jgi:hypothetical protein
MPAKPRLTCDNPGSTAQPVAWHPVDCTFCAGTTVVDGASAVRGYAGRATLRWWASYANERLASACQRRVGARGAAYLPYCPYTAHPNAGGVWSGPDLAKARKLVSASGTRGEKVVVWTGDRPFMLAAGRLVLATLRQLGYRASWKKVPGDPGIYFSKAYDFHNHIQIGFMGWGPDYPAPSNFAGGAVLQLNCGERKCSSHRYAGGVERAVGGDRSHGDGPRSMGAAREPTGRRLRLPTPR